MRRGELSGSAPLKEPGASKTRLKDGTHPPLDSACAAITSYQSINRLSPRRQQGGSYCRPNFHHRVFEGIYP
ncbi:uncharacterized protein ACO6RY_15703 [Pungitius sinensis]